jgi:hypothetical protein
MNKNKVITKSWAFAGGHIPLQSTGHEPLFTSHDKIAILNFSNEDAKVKMIIYYADSQPVEGHELEVRARRVRKIRFNDLIDPLPIPLDTPYGFVLISTVGVVVQFSRAITAQRSAAGFCVTPYSAAYE